SPSVRVLMEPQHRSKRVLAALVRAHIASGEPVASSYLVNAAGIGVSSATVRNILTAVEARLRRESPGRLIDGILPQVSHVLSQAARTVGFAVGPAHEAAVFDRVEFVPIAGARVLVVIVARGGHVVQKVIDTGEALTADELRQAANYLNAEFAGLPLHRAREAVLE